MKAIIQQLIDSNHKPSRYYKDRKYIGLTVTNGDTLSASIFWGRPYNHYNHVAIFEIVDMNCGPYAIIADAILKQSQERGLKAVNTGQGLFSAPNWTQPA